MLEVFMNFLHVAFDVFVALRFFCEVESVRPSCFLSME
jgi:hypothetical protein